MIGTKNRLLSFVIVILLIITSVITPMTAEAANKKTLTVTHTDGKTVKAAIDVMEDDFNTTDTDWKSVNGNVSTAEAMSTAPYSSYEGSGSLLVVSDGSKYLSATKTPKNLVSLKTTPIVTVTVFVPKHADGAALTLTLSTNAGEIKSSLSLEGGCWQTLFFDFSKEKGKTVSKISVSVSHDSAKDLYFLLDCVGGCKSETSIFTAKYTFRDYTVSGCNANTENGLSLSFASGENFIEAYPVFSDLGIGHGIRVCLSNASTCSSVTFTVKTEGEGEDTQTYNIASGVTSFTVPIPYDTISSFKMSFDNDPTGSVDILSIAVVQCYSPDKSIGNVSEVRIGRDKKSITVSASISEEDFEGLQGSKVRLYELRLDQDVSDITLSVSPMLEAELSASAFEFVFPIDDNKDRAFKKYAVVAVSSDGLIPIGQAKAVNNPGIFAEERVTLPETIKGSSVLNGNYFLDGISQTTVNVYADELISTASGGISYTDGTRKYTFSQEYVKNLDTVMKRYDLDGIAVRFILMLRSPSDTSQLTAIHHPENNGGRYSAFNTTSSSGINTLRAITSFLISRYSLGDQTDNLFGIIVGSDVNDSFESYNMGSSSFSDLILTYTAAFRIVYNTARMMCSGFEVSVPINNSWNRYDTASTSLSYEASSFINSFALCISSSSDIEWSLSCDITPSGKSYAYEETSVDKTCLAKNITASNLEAPISFLRQRSVLFNGVARKLILAGVDIRQVSDSDDMKKLSADYVYTYLRALSFKEISAYIPSHPADHENVIRYIDTQLFEEKTAFASELIGNDRFNDLVQGSNESTTRFYLSQASDGVLPQSIKGKVKLFSFSKNADGFIPHVNCAAAEGGISYGDSKGLMRFRLSSTSKGTYGGVTAKLDEIIDLSSAPYISFNIRVSALPEGVNSLEVAVAVGSGRSMYVSTSKIYAGKDNKVIFDLSEFPNRSTCDKISIYVTDIYGTDIGEPTLLVSSITAMSEKLSGTALKDAIYNRSDRIKVSQNTVIAVMICGAVSISVLALRLTLALRRRKLSQQNQ